MGNTSALHQHTNTGPSAIIADLRSILPQKWPGLTVRGCYLRLDRRHAMADLRFTLRLMVRNGGAEFAENDGHRSYWRAAR